MCAKQSAEIIRRHSFSCIAKARQKKCAGKKLEQNKSAEFFSDTILRANKRRDAFITSLSLQGMFDFLAVFRVFQI